MRLYITILSALFLLSCHNRSYKDFLENKIGDYLINIQKKNNYESILLGKLDSAFTVVNETKPYQEYKQRKHAFEAMEILSKQFPNIYSEDEAKANKEQENYFQAICDSLELAFVPEFIGWKIQHIYAYRNYKKEHVVDNHILYLDKDMQDVIKDEQIYTNLPYATYYQDTVFYGIK